MVKKIRIKFISVILTLAMVISLLPAVTLTAWALDPPDFSPSKNETNVPVTVIPKLTFDGELCSGSSGMYMEAMGANPTGVIRVYEGTDNSGTRLTEGSESDNSHFTVNYTNDTDPSLEVIFGADLKNNQSYYVELQGDKVFGLDGNALSSVGMTFKTEVAPVTYTATINTYKDGSLAALGTVGLLRGTKKYTMTAGTTEGVFTASVPNGTYDVCVNDYDTGTDITIDGADPESVDVNYYTVKYEVSDAKDATGSTISATYGGAPFDSGAVLLGGRTLVITVRSNDVYGYTYAWSGAGTNNETSMELTISSLGKTVDATCTVTGEGADGGSVPDYVLINGVYWGNPQPRCWRRLRGNPRKLRRTLSVGTLGRRTRKPHK